MRGFSRQARSGIPAFLWVLVMVGASVLIPVPTQADSDVVDPVPLEWWGDTEIGEGFHLRVPVTVENQREHDVENGAVFAEVDITKKLIEAGWVSQARSGEDLLRLFELDEASVRVVAMTDLEPMTDSSVHGRLALYSKQFPPGDLRRHEVPSTHFQGFLEGEESTEFNPRTNPIITVMWRIPGTMEPEDVRHFMVYFDSTTNAEIDADRHSPADYRGVEGFELLERSFWSGPSTDLVGFVSPDAPRRPLATVIGLHDDTEVTVFIGQADGTFALQGSVSTHDNPFTVDAEEFKDIFISNTDGTPFRLQADKPILALVASEGYVPSPSGGLQVEEGGTWLFSTTHPPGRDQQGLYFFNMRPGHTATIQVDNLGAGSSQTVTLNGGGNFFPYTIDPHSNLVNDGTCQHPPTVRTAQVPAGRGDFRAEVTSGGPVILQYEPVHGVTQIPATDGSPTGTEFWTAASKTACNGVTRQHHMYAISDQGTTLGTYNPFESPKERLFPECTKSPCPDGQPIGPLPDEAFLRQPFQGLEDLPDRPVRIQTGDPAWFMMGPAPIPNSLDAVPLRGPLGGEDAGRVFNGVGSTSDGRSEPPYIYAPFRGTQVLADIDHAASKPIRGMPLNLLGEHISTLPTRAGDPILSYRLDADRPIIVAPRGSEPGFLAGTPVTLDETVHGADYKGYLVRIRSTTGLNPVSGATVPGESVTYPLEITNLGKQAGGKDLIDTIKLSQTGAPDGWSVAFSQQVIQLKSGDSKIVQMTVTPPDDAKTDSLTPIHVHATSSGNDKITHSLEVDTFIKSSYSVGIWFDGTGFEGKKLDRGSAPRGVPINYTVFVQNLGTVKDTALLEVAPKRWSALLLDEDGVQASAVELPPTPKGLGPGQPNPSVKQFTLQVVPPEDSEDGFLQTTVTATSLNSPAEQDKVFAISKVSAPSDLSLVTEDRTAWAAPGDTTQFNFSIRNDGEGGAQAFFELRSDMLPGWADPTVYLRNPSTGALTPFPTDPPRLSIGGEGEVVHLAVTLRVAPEALAGDQVATRLQVSASGEDGRLEAFFDAITLPDHRIDVVPPDGALTMRSGGILLPVEVRINNTGNLDEQLDFSAVSLPPGWNFSFPAEQVVLPRGVTQVLDIGVMAPFGVSEGTYDIAFALVSKDGVRTEVPLTIDVGAFAKYAADGTLLLSGQPGRTVWAVHEVRNDGNVLLEMSLEPAAGEPWDLADPDRTYQVPPGANMTLPIGWHVPSDAINGASIHKAQVRLDAVQPSAVPTTHETVTVTVNIGRADLQILDASTFDGPGGQIVQITAANTGARTAYGVDVQLRVGGEAVAEAHLSVIPPGTERRITLLWPDGPDRAASKAVVVIDPYNVVVESDESNNVLSIGDGSDESVATPGLGIVPTVGIVAFAFLMRRPPMRCLGSLPGRAMARMRGRSGHAVAGNYLSTPSPADTGCGDGCGRSGHAGMVGGGHQ